MALTCQVVTNLTCALNKHGMGDNTLLVIVSDNGGDSNLKYSGKGRHIAS